MTGRKLAAALVAIVLLTLVLPPLAAREVNARRIARAQQDVQVLADWMASADRRAELAALIPASTPRPVILTGLGAAPKTAHGLGWPEGRTFPAISLFGGRVDPWGNHYLILLTDGADGRVVVLSAGPNGIVETPIGARDAPVGDDVATIWNVRLKPDATSK